MKTLEQAKHDGMVDALRNRIRELRNRINDSWKNTESNGRMIRLEVAINSSDEYLKSIRETLTALKELGEGDT
jgi:hypothetical protein